jgi:hypothetical protein
MNTIANLIGANSKPSSKRTNSLKIGLKDNNFGDLIFMPKFKVGDRVRVVSVKRQKGETVALANWEGLKIGDVALISEVENKIKYYMRYQGYRVDTRPDGPWLHEDCFELVEDLTENGKEK